MVFFLSIFSIFDALFESGDAIPTGGKIKYEHNETVP